MRLSCEQKRKIFNSYPELTEVISSDGRISYRFEGSNWQRKQIAQELSYTGNSYIYGNYLIYSDYPVDSPECNSALALQIMPKKAYMLNVGII